MSRWPAPTSPAAAVSGVNVVVTWSHVAGTKWVDVYRQRYGVDSGRGPCVASKLSVTGTSGSWTDTSVPLGAQVRYWLYATDTLDDEVWSIDQVRTSWVTASLAAPGWVQARRVGADVVVSWPSSDTATGALVQASGNGGVSWADVATVSGAPAPGTATHAGASQTVSWVYRVRYEVGGLAGSWSAASLPVGPVAPPAAPTGLAPTTGFDPSGAQAFGWVHTPTDTTDQTAYELQYREQGASSWTTTGKVMSSVSSRMISAGTFTARRVIEWQVRTYGLHASPGAWSAVATVVAASRPVASFLSPPAGTFAGSALAVVGGYYQAQGVPVAGARWSLLTGGSVIETQSSVGDSLQVSFARPVLDATAYQVRLEVVSADGLWSDPALLNLSVAYVPPPAPVVVGVWDEATARVSLTIGNPAGTPAAVSNTVARDGMVVAREVGPNSAWTDQIPPLESDVVYTVSAVSALPSTAATTVTVSTRGGTPRVWLNGGPGMILAAPIEWNPEIGIETERVVELVSYAGRVSPVGYDGVAVDWSGTVGGDVSTVAGWDQVVAVTTAQGVGCYRDPDGRRVFVRFGRAETTAGYRSRHVKPVRVPATRVFFDEGA